MLAAAMPDVTCGQCIQLESSRPPSDAEHVGSWGAGPLLGLGAAGEPTAAEMRRRDGWGLRLTVGAEVGSWAEGLVWGKFWGRGDADEGWALRVRAAAEGWGLEQHLGAGGQDKVEGRVEPEVGFGGGGGGSGLGSEKG